jgi:phosphoribosylformylglycinamidine synthase
VYPCLTLTSGLLTVIYRHCRHKVFNSSWIIDGVAQDQSLFGMIRATHNKTPQFTVSAYSDNAAVIEGDHANVWAPDYSTGSWKLIPEVVHILTKVEVWFALLLSLI